MSRDNVIIEREILIAASPETIFAFLVDPMLMAQWFGRNHTLEPRPGGMFCVQVSLGHLARGVFTEVVPYRKVALTWGWEFKDPSLAALKPGESLVEIELEPRDGGTLVRLRHSRLPKDISEIHADRWSFYLDRLRSAILESKKETQISFRLFTCRGCGLPRGPIKCTDFHGEWNCPRCHATRTRSETRPERAPAAPALRSKRLCSRSCERIRPRTTGEGQLHLLCRTNRLGPRGLSQ